MIGVGIPYFLHERLPFYALKLTKYRLNVLCLQHFLRGHMSNIPFEKQLLPVNPVEQIEHQIAQRQGRIWVRTCSMRSSAVAIDWTTASGR